MASLGERQKAAQKQAEEKLEKGKKNARMILYGDHFLLSKVDSIAPSVWGRWFIMQLTLGKRMMPSSFNRSFFEFEIEEKNKEGNPKKNYYYLNFSHFSHINRMRTADCVARPEPDKVALYEDLKTKITKEFIAKLLFPELKTLWEIPVYPLIFLSSLVFNVLQLICDGLTGVVSTPIQREYRDSENAIVKILSRLLVPIFLPLSQILRGIGCFINYTHFSVETVYYLVVSSIAALFGQAGSDKPYPPLTMLLSHFLKVSAYFLPTFLLTALSITLIAFPPTTLAGIILLPFAIMPSIGGSFFVAAIKALGIENFFQGETAEPQAKRSVPITGFSLLKQLVSGTGTMLKNVFISAPQNLISSARKRLAQKTKAKDMIRVNLTAGDQEAIFTEEFRKSEKVIPTGNAKLHTEELITTPQTTIAEKFPELKDLIDYRKGNTFDVEMEAKCIKLAACLHHAAQEKSLEAFKNKASSMGFSSGIISHTQSILPAIGDGYATDAQAIINTISIKKIDVPYVNRVIEKIEEMITNQGTIGDIQTKVQSLIDFANSRQFECNYQTGEATTFLFVAALPNSKESVYPDAKTIIAQIKQIPKSEPGTIEIHIPPGLPRASLDNWMQELKKDSSIQQKYRLSHWVKHADQWEKQDVAPANDAPKPTA